MISFQVKLKNVQYPIFTGQGLLEDTLLWQQVTQDRPVFIVTDQNTGFFYLAKLAKILRLGPEKNIILPSGEGYKNFDSLSTILTRLTEEQFPRDGILIALGGGVIGDITGFAAAVYQRGVDFIQVPTTMLAMLDSSVGGKTAINLGAAKNNIGAFHQPIAVLMDLNTLATLSQREYAAGLAEAVKHALIQGGAFFNWLQSKCDLILARDVNLLAELIQTSCRIKAEIVAADEFEQAGPRMLLNLGHTFGHALEAYNNYRDFKHGEAVAIGMIIALKWSAVRGILQDAALIDQTTQLLQAFLLPIQLPSDYNAEKLIYLMQYDKKKRNGILNLILVKTLGDTFVYPEVDLPALQSFLRDLA